MRSLPGVRNLGTAAILPIYSIVFMVEEFFASKLSTHEGARLAPWIFSIGNQIYLKKIGITILTVIIIVTIISKVRFSDLGKKIFFLIFALACTFLVFTTNMPIKFSFLILAPYLTLIVSYLLGRHIDLSNAAKLDALLFRIFQFFNTVVFLRLLWILQAGQNLSFSPFYDGLAHILLSSSIVFLLIKIKNYKKTTSVPVNIYALLVMALSNYILIISLAPRRLAIFATALVFFIFSFTYTKNILIKLFLLILLTIPGFPLIATIYQALSNYINLGVANSSDLGHFLDIQRGLEYCLRNQILAPKIEADSVFATTNIGNLYIHNEVFQSCISGGQVFGLLAIFFSLSIFNKVRSCIVKNSSSTTGWFCIAILVSYLVMSLGFPVLQQSVRWQILVGTCFGILSQLEKVSTIQLFGSKNK
jgi:hypothetical protein